MNKRLTIVIISISIIALLFGAVYYNKTEKEEIINKQEPIKEEQYVEKEIIKFLRSISGMKANEIDIIDNPVGFKGELVLPKESIQNGIEYFLKNTNNEKMKELKIEVEPGYIRIYVEYEPIKNIKTPIEVEVIPEIDENEDLAIYIKEVRFLDLKIANWIVDFAMKSFIKDWFPEESQSKMEFNRGNVVLYKENFGGVYLKDIIVTSNELKINAIVNLDQVLGGK